MDAPIKNISPSPNVPPPKPSAVTGPGGPSISVPKAGKSGK